MPSPGNLNYLYNGALLLQLLLRFLCFLLGNTFFHLLGSGFNEVLGFLETKSGDFPDNLDDLNLVLTKALQNNVKLCFFFLGSSGSSSSPLGLARQGRSCPRAVSRSRLHEEQKCSLSGLMKPMLPLPPGSR